jgi:hypothetical protein
VRGVLTPGRARRRGAWTVRKEGSPGGGLARIIGTRMHRNEPRHGALHARNGYSKCESRSSGQGGAGGGGILGPSVPDSSLPNPRACAHEMKVTIEYCVQ